MIQAEATPKLVSDEALAQAEAVYLSIWNMVCSDCATCLHNGLMQLESVLKVDIFYRQGVGVVIFVPSMITSAELLNTVENIGKEACHYYGAEVIGQSSAKQALRLA
jgi:hypothetical protein